MQVYGMFTDEVDSVDVELPSQDEYFVPHIIQDVSELLHVVHTALDTGLISIDTETTGLHKYKDELVSISFACCVDSKWHGWYIDWWGTSEEWQQSIRKYLYGLMVEPAVLKVYFNAAFDIHHMSKKGIEEPNGYVDVRPKCWLLDERDQPHRLKDLSKKYLDWEMVEFKQLAEVERKLRTAEALRQYELVHQTREVLVDVFQYRCPKCRGWKSQPKCKRCGLSEDASDAVWESQIKQQRKQYVPDVGVIRDIRDVRLEVKAPYAMADAVATGMLYQYVEPKLKQEWPFQHRFYDKVEHPLIPVVYDMESHGIAVDMPFFEELHQKAVVEESDIAERIYEQVGERINLSSTADRSRVLFDKLRYPRVDGNSTDKGVLKELVRRFHPEATGDSLPELMQLHQDWSKLINGFLVPLPNFVYNGRLYTTFDPNGTRTGRFTSYHPNLQQSTKKFNYRAGFVAPAGRKLIVADFKQMELVMCCHFSKEQEMISALMTGEDLHKKTIGYVLNKPVDEVTKAERAIGKCMNFGLIFRQSEKGFGQFLAGWDIILDSDTLHRYYTGFFNLYRGIRPWHERQIRFVEQYGYAETWAKRRRLLPEAQSDIRKVREWAYRRAINTCVQGSCADLVKIGMIDLYKRWQGTSNWLIAQIHDEIICEVDDDDAVIAQAIADIRYAFERHNLTVPMSLDINVAANWAEGKG